MFSLIKKEIISFFGGLTGYLIALVFLISNGLFLWVFPTSFNLIDNGYANLSPYFQLAPWMFLFLIPALTMRLFAEEKRLGTFEILLTRPFSTLQLVLAKYIAGVFLVVVCMLPTLVYFYSIYQLGNPVGNWDSGAAWGSFIGLFFLAASYTAIGVFSSSLTDNPIFSFVTALFLSFAFFSGFEFIAELSDGNLQYFLSNLGINQHYASMSRGVLDSRDLLYFLVLIATLLIITALLLRRKQQSVRKQWIKFAKYALVFVVVLFVSQHYFFRLDLTSEKRYSLADVSKEMVAELEYPVYVELFLTGDLPAGFRQLKQAVQEKVEDIDAWSSQPVQLYETDPYEITDSEERNAFFNQLANVGLQPTDIRQNTEEGTSTKLVFPGAVVQYGDQYIAVNLLKNNQALPADVNLNNSIETLEYEIMNAIQQLTHKGSLPEVSFLQGQNELGTDETLDIRQTLASNYRVSDKTARNLLEADTMPKAVIIADPSSPFSEQDKYYIDQYLMRGGNLMYLIDPVQVSLDSLSRGETTIAFPRDLNIMDQLFKYGVRVNPNLVQDVECVLIPVNTSPVPSQPKFTPSPWYYSPLLTPSPTHVISRNIERIKSEFVSSIDLVGHKDDLQKSVILQTSAYGRTLGTPQEVSLRSVNNPPARELFHTADIPTGVLVEGSFESGFSNRMTGKLNDLGIETLENSKPAKLIVFSDGSLIANKVSYASGERRTQALGYDMYSKKTFGNKELLLNAISYLTDNSGIMQLRSRVFKIRTLDKVKLREDKSYWQFINLCIPIFFILLLGLIYHFVRVKKYRK